MTHFSVDYEADYVGVDGVEEVIYTSRDGDEFLGVKVKRASLTVAEYSTGVFGVSPSDVGFTIWADRIKGLGRDPKPNDTLTTTDGDVYSILGVLKRSDGAQFRAFCRKQIL